MCHLIVVGITTLSQDEMYSLATIFVKDKSPMNLEIKFYKNKRKT
ncbi:hypothetical protein DU19_0472 [Chlamydia muridarum]|nr:hypothetical protein TAC_02255 [Chlamydia muridarum str. Nigg3 CMUT3-5]AHH24243.1 hypothetical protein Y015_02255 [Chlamydia muridarum str. Nigg CM972]KDU80298.1 hypothetical protein DU17_0474 [Chlamydia muridarum]KDU81436.1 hypothetical protein DU18_0474 [Chlamydia muridarum]KDU82204.1 hypothetical protein DU19_0472 [Chlamydia muridarum]